MLAEKENRFNFLLIFFWWCNLADCHDHFACDKSWHQIHVALMHSNQHRVIDWDSDNEESWNHQKILNEFKCFFFKFIDIKN